MKENLTGLVNKLNDKYLALGVLLFTRLGDTISTGIGASIYGPEPEQNDLARKFLEEFGPWIGNIGHELVVWGPMLVCGYGISKVLGKKLDMSPDSIQTALTYSVALPGLYIIPHNFYNIFS
ncbi:hypothetical protein CL618_01135 [archaeon]|nr:hypothetical protein [archaeon]|tara:strand:- start:829 stop:1194 length:366 start_codon:yes stop_codon:yes gene_type:complete